MSGYLPVDPRPISPAEATVIRRTLELAHQNDWIRSLLATIAGLVVVARCPCGCASVRFDGPADGTRGGIAAEAVGAVSDGRLVGIILWTGGDHLRSMEVHDYDPGSSVTLPTAESLRRG